MVSKLKLIGVLFFFDAVALVSGGDHNDKSSPPPRVSYTTSVDGCDVKFIENPNGLDFFIAKCPSRSTTVTHNRPSGGQSVPQATVTQEEDLKATRAKLVESEAKLAESNARLTALNKLTAQERVLLGLAAMGGK